MSDPVVILGMHRSGTSYLASVVAGWGVGLGERLLSAAADNPRGYFEDEDFVQFHASILQRHFGENVVNNPLGHIYTRDPEPVRLTSSEEEQGGLLVARRRPLAFWGWKDPRTCLFLDFWLKIFPGATLLAVYRHPLEVYGSIVRRKSLEIVFDEALAIDSWTIYNRAILRAWKTHRGPKLLVGANAAFSHSNDLVRRLTGVLGKRETADRPLPEFSTDEFRDWAISASIHARFAEVFPDADEVHNELQHLADVPLQQDEHAEDRRSTPLQTIVETIKPLGAGARSTVLPVIACAVHPAFAAEHAQFRHAAAEYFGARLREADRFASDAERVFDEYDALSQRHDQLYSSVRRHEEIAAERDRLVKELDGVRRYLERVRNQGDLSEALRLMAAQSSRARGALEIFIWGAGSGGRRVHALLKSFGGKTTAFFDSDSKKTRATIDGVPVVSPPDLAALRSKRAFVFVGSTSAAEIEKELRSSGCEARADYWVVDFTELAALESISGLRAR